MQTESEKEINESEIFEAETWLEDVGERDVQQAVTIVDNLLTIIRYLKEENTELELIKTGEKNE